MPRARLRPIVIAGINFVERWPSVHLLLKTAYPFIPGLQTVLRRMVPLPEAAIPSSNDIESMLMLNRSCVLPGPNEAVTVEQLVLLSRSS